MLQQNAHKFKSKLKTSD